MSRSTSSGAKLILDGKAFGAAGAVRKAGGQGRVRPDPKQAINKNIVDLGLAPRDARAKSGFSADFYMLKPVDPARGNGRLFYEIGNRGGKSMLITFQKAKGSRDPQTAKIRRRRPDEPGLHPSLDGLAMGRPQRPDAHGHAHRHRERQEITGLVRGNFIPNDTSRPVLADRNHLAYAIAIPTAPTM